jgi:hypothetical protein
MNRSSPPAVAVTLALVAGLAVAVGLTAGVVPSDSAPGDTPVLDTTAETAPSASSPVAAANGDPPYLAPPAPTVSREEYTQPGIDISAAAATDAQRLRGHHSAATFEERTAGADDRTAFIESAMADIEADARALDEQHAQLVASYRDGEASTRQLLRELARLEAAAAEHRRLADRVETVVDGSTDLDLSQEVDELSEALSDEILALESPVTDALVAGEFAAGTTVYAQAGASAVVLAVANATHVRRQATLRSQRDRNATNQFIEQAGEDENANSLALERAEELYGEDNVRGFFPPAFEATTVYGITGDTDGGSFAGYLDGATENIFHEQQTVVSAGVPVTDTLTDAVGGLELTVNTTTATGPMRVSLTDGDDPVDGATLQVDNRTVGTTDANGQHWVVQPLSGAELSVTVDDERLTVTLP